MGVCKVCGGDLGNVQLGVTYHVDCFFAMHGKRKAKQMKRPVAIQGNAGKLAAAQNKPGGGITQVTDTLFQVQGSDAKAYTVDLQGSDTAISGQTATCTCPNWKIERNRRFGNGTFSPGGYHCKHIEKVLAGDVAVKAKEISAAQAQAITDEILSTFVKGKK